VIIAGLSAALFALLSAMPGNPVDMLITSNPRVKPEDIIRLKKLRGLDKPWYVQYWRWLAGYYDPHRPPQVGSIPDQLVSFRDKKGRGSIDLRPYLSDRDSRFTKKSLADLLKKERPNIMAAIAADPQIQNASENNELDSMFEKIASLDPQFFDSLEERLRQKALLGLSVSGLFGAKANGSVLEYNLDEGQDPRVWFSVMDETGLSSVGSFNVVSTQSAQILQADVRSLSLSAKVVDKPEEFFVDLKTGLQISKPAITSIIWNLLPGSPGQINRNGIYRHVFDGPGQSVIKALATTGNGRKIPIAFAVEHGPLPNLSRYNYGFLSIFAGKKEALGFSNTYKRPVWDLLAGPSSICGNGQQEPGETCDDGNLLSGDACSSACQLENGSIWSRIEATLTGLVMGQGRIMNTLQLMLPAILISLLIAIPLGILSAYRQYSWLDYTTNFFAFIGISLPVFWFGIMVMFLFAEKLQWFPAGGMLTPGIQDEGLFAIILDRHIIIAIHNSIILQTPNARPGKHCFCQDSATEKLRN